MRLTYSVTTAIPCLISLCRNGGQECLGISLLHFHQELISSHPLCSTKYPVTVYKSYPVVFAAFKLRLINLYLHSWASNFNWIVDKLFTADIPDKIVPINCCLQGNLTKKIIIQIIMYIYIFTVVNLHQLHRSYLPVESFTPKMNYSPNFFIPETAVGKETVVPDRHTTFPRASLGNSFCYQNM